MPTNDVNVFMEIIKKYIFNKYGASQAMISEGGTHFYNPLLKALLYKYRVQYRITTPYHPQTSEQLRL